jgi:hypothetical protein
LYGAPLVTRATAAPTPPTVHCAWALADANDATPEFDYGAVDRPHASAPLVAVRIRTELHDSARHALGDERGPVRKEGDSPWHGQSGRQDLRLREVVVAATDPAVVVGADPPVDPMGAVDDVETSPLAGCPPDAPPSLLHATRHSTDTRMATSRVEMLTSAPTRARIAPVPWTTPTALGNWRGFVRLRDEFASGASSPHRQG